MSVCSQVWCLQLTCSDKTWLHWRVFFSHNLVPIHVMSNGPLKQSHRKSILIRVGYFTKSIEANIFGEITRMDVRKFVWKNIILHHRVPYEIVTDNVPNLTCRVFDEFCRKWKICLITTTLYYPQENKQVESTNKTIIVGLKNALELKKGLDNRARRSSMFPWIPLDVHLDMRHFS